MANKYPEAYCLEGSTLICEIRSAVICRIDSLRDDMVNSVKNDRFWLLDAQKASITTLMEFVKALDEKIVFQEDEEAPF